MVAKYGLMHRTADFIKQSISIRNPDSAYLLSVIQLIKDLDRIQDQNPGITILPWANDGIWVNYQGIRVFLILPRKGELRILIHKDASDVDRGLRVALEVEERKGSVAEISRADDYFLWKLPADKIPIIIDFLDALPWLSNPQLSNSHPRYFPGEVRQVALDLFERNGRWCNGVSGLADRHKVKMGEPVEFDHILPFAKGGASSDLNIQVLCVDCNRLKLARAL